MKRFLVSLFATTLFLPSIAFSAPLGWDYANGQLQPVSGVGRTSEILGAFFHSTNTSAINLFPKYSASQGTTTEATSTRLTSTTICLTGDTCRTTWPTGAQADWWKQSFFNKLVLTPTTSISVYAPQLYADRSTSTAATTTALSVSGSFTGAGLSSCSTGLSGITWNSATQQFGCNTFVTPFGKTWEVVGGGTGSVSYLAPTSTIGIVANASSSIFGLDMRLSTSTNATSTNQFTQNLVLVNATGTSINVTRATSSDLAVLGTLDIGSLGGVLIGTSGIVSAGVNGTNYTLVTGTSCSGTDKVTAITAAGVVTCSGAGLISPDWLKTTFNNQLVLTSSTTIPVYAPQLFSDRSTSTHSSSTNLAVSGDFKLTGLSDGCLQVSTGLVVSTGSGCGVGGGGVPFGKTWEIVTGGAGTSNYLAPTTTIGIVVGASSTIGNGTNLGGLTVSGSATTTGTSTMQRLVVGQFTSTLAGQNVAGIVEPPVMINGSSSQRSGMILQNLGSGPAPEFRFVVADANVASNLEYLAFGLTNSNATSAGALNGLTKSDLTYVVSNSGRDLLLGQSGGNTYISGNILAAFPPTIQVNGLQGYVGIGLAATSTIPTSLLTVNGGFQSILATSTHATGTTLFLVNGLVGAGSSTISRLTVQFGTTTNATSSSLVALFNFTLPTSTNFSPRLIGGLGVTFPPNMAPALAVGTTTSANSAAYLPLARARSFMYATTSWTGSTTDVTYFTLSYGERIGTTTCASDRGTLLVRVGNGTIWSNQLAVSSATSSTNFIINNTFNKQGTKIVFEIGTPASNPQKIWCSFESTSINQ